MTEGVEVFCRCELVVLKDGGDEVGREGEEVCSAAKEKL